MKFNNGKYIIEVDFTYKYEEDEEVACFNKSGNRIRICVESICHMYKEFKAENIKIEIHKILIHELTHWFDWNCFDSFQQYGYCSDKTEVIAMFNQLFHIDIEQFANMIMESKQVQKYIKS